MAWVERPQNYKDLYGILQLLGGSRSPCPGGSHFNNFPLKTLILGWVAFHSETIQLKRLDNIRNSSQSSHVSAIGYEIRL